MKATYLAIAACVALFCVAAQADTCWWFECDGDWFQPDYWSCSHIPACGDTLYIDEGCGGPLISGADAACAGLPRI
jgi:hypothetical protein